MSEKNDSAAEVHVTEGIAGMWFYHLSKSGNNTRSLCGKQVMNTQLPLSSWGVKGHLNERYCSDCANAAREELLKAGVTLKQS